MMDDGVGDPLCRSQNRNRSRSPLRSRNESASRGRPPSERVNRPYPDLEPAHLGRLRVASGSRSDVQSSSRVAEQDVEDGSLFGGYPSLRPEDTTETMEDATTWVLLSIEALAALSAVAAAVAAWRAAASTRATVRQQLGLAAVHERLVSLRHLHPMGPETAHEFQRQRDYLRAAFWAVGIELPVTSRVIDRPANPTPEAIRDAIVEVELAMGEVRRLLRA